MDRMDSFLDQQQFLSEIRDLTARADRATSHEERMAMLEDIEALVAKGNRLIAEVKKIS